jgi:hypothetical protein
MASAVLDALPGAATPVGAKAPAYLQGLVDYQHPDHDTPAGWTAPTP